MFADLQMKGVTDVSVENCSFETTFNHSDICVNALTAVDSYFKVNENCTFKNYYFGNWLMQSNGSIIKSNYEDNFMGIFYSGGASNDLAACKFNENDFLNNEYGIQTSNLIEAEIKDNFFVVGGNTDNCGIYYHGEYSTIENNTFSGLSNSQSTNFGLIMTHNLSNNNKLNYVIDNAFRDTNIGLSCEGSNMEISVRCNSFGFDGNPHGISAWRMTDNVLNHGSCGEQLEEDGLPAGNKWHYCVNGTSNCANPDIADFWADYAVATESGTINNDFIPTYRTYATSSEPGYRLLPNYTDPLKLDFDYCISAESDQNCVPTIPEPTGPVVCNQIYWINREAMLEEINQLKDQEQIILNSLDNGNTLGLIQEINDPMLSQTEIKEELVNIDHLSTTVQIEAIDRFDPLSSNTLKDVLLPQAPYDGQVINELNNRVQPVATSAYDAIIEAHINSDEVVNLTNLKMQINQLDNDIKLLDVNEWLCLKRTGNETEMVDMLKRYDYPVFKHELVQYYLEKGDVTEARNALNDATDLSENYVNYVSLMIDLKETGRTIQDLEETELELLHTIAETGTNEYETVQAQLTLQMLGERVYIPYITPIGEIAGKRPFVPDDEALFADRIIVSPNPASTFVSFQTTTEKEAIITVYNVNGQKMSDLHIDKGDIVSEIEVQNWTAGVYFFQLHSNGVNLQSGKFTIQH